ncbi:MAG: response regulator transcription factor [Anaerolineales bacterium]
MVPRKIRVLIADDHAVVSEGLQLYLENAGLEVVGRAASGRQTIDLADDLKPDVVLLDIAMPDMDGMQALTALKRAHPRIVVIMVTASGNPAYMAQAITKGAAGYILKETSPSGIPHVIRSAYAGQSIVDPRLLRAALLASPEPKPKLQKGEKHVPLTRQELRVLGMLAKGMDNASIASALVVSRNTVKSHVRKVLRKLNVSDRTQAAIWAIRNGMVD